MADTFDPTAHVSAGECVRALKEQGISVSHRLGARIFSLGARRVRFSLAFLEEAAAQPELLMGDFWRDLAPPHQPRRIEQVLEGRAGVQLEGEIAHVLTPDELDAGAPSSSSLLPAVLGRAEPARMSGVLWDRRRLEEAALTLLDAESPTELVENFRYLFRATLSSGQDPSGLLVTALRRSKPDLSREVGHLVREHLHRDLGRALETLQEEDPQRVADAVHYLLNARESDVLRDSILLPALLPVLRKSEQRQTLFDSLERLGQVLQSSTLTQQGLDSALEAFLEYLLDDLPQLDSEPRASLTTFLVALASGYPELPGYLLRRLESTVDPGLHVFYAHVLTRVELTSRERSRLLERMQATLLEHGRESAMLENLKLIFARLGEESLEDLSSPAVVARMSPPLRIFLVQLWHHFQPPDVAPLAELAALHLRDRSLLLALVRTRQLLLPQVVERILAMPDRSAIVLYLLQEAFRMEEPDDAVVLELLAHYALEALEPAFARLAEEAALKSGAAATRLLLFGSLARRVQGVEKARLREMVRQLLEFPIFTPESLPAVWLGLGQVGAIRALDERLRKQIIERLGGQLSPYPAVRVQALLALYPAASEASQRLVEGTLRAPLGGSEPAREILSACLAGLEELSASAHFPHEAEELVGMLCRTVLWKGREQSLESVMRQALSYASSGDGVRVPTAWSREDREAALRILGALARHPAGPERLQSLVVVRLFSFLQDWLDAVEKGSDLYAHRDTPLWEILALVLRQRPDPRSHELSREAARQLLEAHRNVPGQVALDRRENAQRFLIEVMLAGQGEDLAVRGRSLNLARSILDTLADLALRDTPEAALSLYLLRDLERSERLEPGLQARLRGFLANRA
ncbi:MAG: hypothetical protein AMXMBFR33_39060 [Candidatus Xenobia bacterium]